MFCRLELALAALPELGRRTRRRASSAAARGPSRCCSRTRIGRFPLACGPEPEVLGVRVPRLAGALAPLRRSAGRCSSRAPTAPAAPTRAGVEDVDERIRAGVDLVLDGGELPGTPSTVVDLTGYETDGTFAVLREGAVARGRDALTAALVR